MGGDPQFRDFPVGVARQEETPLAGRRVTDSPIKHQQDGSQQPELRLGKLSGKMATTTLDVPFCITECVRFNMTDAQRVRAPKFEHHTESNYSRKPCP